MTGALADAEALEQQVRRMAFNVFARNRDDHVKNHAFLMGSDGKWQTAPAFDLTYWDAREHEMIVGTEGAAPKLDHMLQVTRAVRMEDEQATRIINEVEAVVREWPSFAKQASVSNARTKEIGEAIQAGLPDLHTLAFAAWQQSQGKGR